VSFLHSIRILLVAAAAALPLASAAEEIDPLSLTSAPVGEQATPTKPWKLFVEGVAGRIEQRGESPALDARRLSIDATVSARLGQGWRFGLSNRLDHSEPSGTGGSTTLNSLREAYLGWQAEEGNLLLEFGRINVRNGPGYGYNPTDYLRDNALRAATTADPLAQRENRLGTVMLRSQYVFDGGVLALALAPKLATSTSTETFSPDFGATNNRHRALATLSGQFSDRISGQVLALFDRERGHQLGASVSALATSATVVFAEVSYGQERAPTRPWLTVPDPSQRRVRSTVGATYSFAAGPSITVEHEYNGHAPMSDELANTWIFAPMFAGGHLLESQRRQDLATRRAYLVYATQRNLVWRGFDVVALWRVNPDDRSRLGWLEARYRWGQADLALQWQGLSGRERSEYGVVPYRRTIQLLGAYYF